MIDRSVRRDVLPALERMAARAGITSSEAERFWRIFHLLTRESLSFVPQAGQPAFSGICRDGSPWQYCAVMGSGTTPVRFLTEVGVPGSPLSVRTALTTQRLAQVLPLIGAEDSSGLAELMADLTPGDESHTGLWIGLAAASGGPPRLRLYANIGWGNGTERWLRLIAALRGLEAGGFAANIQPILGELGASFEPAGLAVTLPSEPRLCKLYLRPSTKPWSTLRSLAPTLLGTHGERLLQGIEDALECGLEELPQHALVISLAGAATGEPLDLKLDLCGHCLFEDSVGVARVMERLGAAFDLDTTPVESMFADLGGSGLRLEDKRVAFLGIGCDAQGENRVNVYLTPGTELRVPEAAAIREA